MNTEKTSLSHESTRINTNELACALIREHSCEFVAPIFICENPCPICGKKNEVKR